MGGRRGGLPAGGAATIDEVEVVAIGSGGEDISLHGDRVKVRFTGTERFGTALLCATGSAGFLARLGGEEAGAQG